MLYIHFEERDSMSRQSGGALLTTLHLDPTHDVPLYRQLESAIRQMILSGDLPPNSRLPATRHLSNDLGVSRLTVKNVYEQLTSEGFLQSRQGDGTYVADIAITEMLLEVPATQVTPPKAHQAISSHAARIAASKSTTRLGGVKAFRPGVPALDQFPRKAWASAHSKVTRDGENALLGYGSPGGLPELKQAIAIHVRDHRGIQCEPEQIIITSGAQQAFVLIALSVLEAGATVWSEDPGHIGVRDAMRALGIVVRSVPINEHGFDLQHAVENYPTASLMFVTPSHQHPLGVTMSLSRRLELLDYAQQHNCWIIEDDYDSEFRYVDRALPASLALDNSGHVLYTGSFSKSLFPALRLGYLISPPELIAAFTAAQTLLSQNVSPLQQKVLAEFMRNGSFNAHIRKMRALYRLRRDLLVAAIERYASEIFELEPCRAGMHLIAWLRDSSLKELDVAQAIWNANIDCMPISIYCDEQKLRPGLMLGFACAVDDDIEGTVKRLARAAHQHARKS
jgi:GntR family transcriptional regulator/MocR family aminotransferase